jgi:hypothetical protein
MKLTVWLLFLTFAVQVSSQDGGREQAHHEHANANAEIDGSKNPELIPDLTAYRLFLLALAKPPEATDSQKAIQMQLAKQVGIPDKDTQMLILIADRFRIDYAALIADFNLSVDLASSKGMPIDHAEFLEKRYALIGSTRDDLAQALSPSALIQLDAVIRSEKTRMKASAQAPANASLAEGKTK